MELITEKFGVINYTAEEVVTFQDGLLGFEILTQYILIDDPKLHPFIWIQSIEDPSVSFVSINPYMFFSDYKIAIHHEDYEAMGIESLADIYVLTLVVVPANNPQEISSNLLAPVIYNRPKKVARQIIMTNSGYQTKHYLLQDRESVLQESVASKKLA